MQLHKAKREQVKLKLGISGPSGTGKTYSSLILASGLTDDYSKIAIIDTENGSANLYSHLGEFNVLTLKAPFSPEAYIKAIEICENAKMEVIIIDSLTHEWSGSGGCLEIHEQLGGRFQDWAPVTKRHQAFIDKIINCNAHIITTVRSKVDYSMDVGSNGRTKVVKQGLKPITREGLDYEMTVFFELINDNHLAKAGKDRTRLFMGKPEFVINKSTGLKLLNWCNNNSDLVKIKQEISQCQTLEGLRHVYSKYPNQKQSIYDSILKRKAELEQSSDLIIPNEEIINQQTNIENGSTTKTAE